MTTLKPLRVAIVQIETHPALYMGHFGFLEEPFVPASGQPSLASLRAKGLDVAQLQTLCLREYGEWLRNRVVAILTYLETFDPPVDLALFPEGSVTLDALATLSEWAKRTGTVVLGGTHSPQRTPGARKIYDDLGVGKDVLSRLFKYGCYNALPVLAHDCTLIPKRLPSIFEKLIVDDMPAGKLPSLQPIDIDFRSGRRSLLPVICAEALQLHNVSRDYDIVGLVSYDTKPGQFHSYITQQTYNKKIVLHCNDGRYGGSLVWSTRDLRTPNWLAEVLPQGLPPGDAILVADIDLDVTAVETGTAAPGSSQRLVGLSSILSSDTGAAQAAARLASIATANPATRNGDLSALLKDPHLTHLQRLRVEYLQTLEARGLPTDRWWTAIGSDLVVAGQPSLRDVERRLSTTCVEQLPTLLTVEASRNPELATQIVAFLATCKEGIGARVSGLPLPPREQGKSTIDREKEIREVHRFLDDERLIVAELTGLPEIGKTAVLKKALAESGTDAFATIPLTATSSAEYVIYSVINIRSREPRPPYADCMAMMEHPGVRAALKSIRMLVLQDAHHLLQRGRRDLWRDDILGAVVERLLTLCVEVGTKVVIESRQDLPLHLPNPGIRVPIRVRGFDKDLLRWGVSLFDAQLRRVGLSPAAISDHDKASIVKQLGGHPVAIALAADVSHNEGREALLKALKEKKGFYLNFLGRLVGLLGLSDQERSALQLLCLARGAIPRETVQSFASAADVRNLVAVGAVEVTQDGWAQISNVLRECFDPQELDPTLVLKFHSVAAEAFAAVVRTTPENVVAAIEAEYHGGVSGVDVGIVTNLADGALATAGALFEEQRYDDASRILGELLRREKSASLDVLRLASRVEARRNRFDVALELARQVFTRNPQDGFLLADLAKTALTLFRDDHIVDEIVAIARAASLEDVNILVVEGRVLLRRGDFPRAEKVLTRARQLTERNAWPYYYLGQLYLRWGRVGDAIDVLFEGDEFCYNNGIRNVHVIGAIKTTLGKAYLYDDRVDLAAPIIERLFEEDPNNPDVVRIYAALAIKRDGVNAAHDVLKKLSETRINNRADRCQFHLIYGLFYVGIGDPHKASAEFAKAHSADRSNVFVMMKWARALYQMGLAAWADGDDVYKTYVGDCARLVKEILSYDRDNADAASLGAALFSKFAISV